MIKNEKGVLTELSRRFNSIGKTDIVNGIKLTEEIDKDILSSKGIHNQELKHENEVER